MIRHTDEHDTPKRCPTVLTLSLVPSGHKVIATRISQGNAFLICVCHALKWRVVVPGKDTKKVPWSIENFQANFLQWMSSAHSVPPREAPLFCPGTPWNRRSSIHNRNTQNIAKCRHCLAFKRLQTALHFAASCFDRLRNSTHLLALFPRKSWQKTSNQMSASWRSISPWLTLYCTILYCSWRFHGIISMHTRFWTHSTPSINVFLFVKNVLLTLFL